MNATEISRGLLLVLAVTVLAGLLSLQGWRSVIPAFDMLTYFENAHNLLHHAVLPERGDISSYGSFSPPGTSWLIALGMIIFKDPRLYEKAGSILLHFGTLWGLFLLTKIVFGARLAFFTVLLYGLSTLALDFAGSLWPIGHPVFYVWMVYFALLWAKHEDAKYLTLAGITWAVGMNVDMAIAPSLLILPAIWLVFHPPIFSWSLFPGMLIFLLVWYPYLRFETQRDFVDLTSQLGRQNIFPANYLSSWCNPYLGIERLDDPSAQPIAVSKQDPLSQTALPVWMSRLVSIKDRLAQGLLANFNQATSIPGASFILLLVTIRHLLCLLVGRPPFQLGNAQSISITQEVYIKMRQWAHWFLTERFRNDSTDGGRLLALSLVIPWFILIVVAEPGRIERFVWLWPLQLLILAAFTAQASSRWLVRQPTVFMSQILLLSLLLPIAGFYTTFESWAKEGWAGREAEEMQVVDYLANQIKKDGKAQASIGYKIFIYPFMADYHIIDSGYKVGADFDLLFKHQYEVINTSRCAEGFSSQDEYRIVQRTPKKDTWAPREFFNVSLTGFKPVGQFGSYEVFKQE